MVRSPFLKEVNVLSTVVRNKCAVVTSDSGNPNLQKGCCECHSPTVVVNGLRIIADTNYPRCHNVSLNIMRVLLSYREE